MLGSRLLAAGAFALVAGAVVVHAITSTAPEHPHNWFIAVVYCLLGERIVAHARRNAVGWTLLVTGVCGAVAAGAGAWPDERWAAWVGTWVWWPTYAALPVVLLLFPTGRPPGRWWWAAVAVAGVGVVLPLVGLGWASWAEPAAFWRQVSSGTARRGVAVGLAITGFAAFGAALAAAVASLVVRWRGARGTHRFVVGWALVGTLVLVPTLGLELLFGSAWGAWLAAAAAFPAALAVAIVRHDLYDIELVIHRTLLYGLLGALLVCAYTAVVLVTTARVPAYPTVIATVVVVAALGPLHQKLRRALERWLYGDRSDPYRAMVALSRTLAEPRRPHELLPALAASVGRSLRLPYVEVQLSADSARSGVHGRSCGWDRLQVDLWHGEQRVGVLVAEERAGDEKLGPRDRRLLEHMAVQAAPAVHAARLALALRAADARFEQRRRQELHRIGNDLHDIIGPSVAGIHKQVKGVLRAMSDDDGKARRRLSDAAADLETLTGTVREVVRSTHVLDLRLGLEHALHRLAERFDGETAVRVVATGRFDDVPAEVELAAYLVISEALTNVVRHAEASNCRVDVVGTACGLDVVVADDGRGMPDDPVPGVGLESMEERCQDLGGEFHVEPSSPGTRITARIPFGRT
ncbi:sensor histidine kinase [Umezawaea sp.]|uniref:sensor histidine kinase n=1 Tax=Umezawaea sp. TaxID=1955258 RepID=UPI002ED1C097